MHKGVMRIGDHSFRIHPMPPDGRCGYHAMQFHRPLPDGETYEAVLKTDGWATHADFERLAAVAERPVHMHELKIMANDPDTAERCGIPDAWLKKTGICRLVVFGGSQGGEPMHVLHHRKHYDALSPLAQK